MHQHINTRIGTQKQENCTNTHERTNTAHAHTDAHTQTHTRKNTRTHKHTRPHTPTNTHTPTLRPRGGGAHRRESLRGRPARASVRLVRIMHDIHTYTYLHKCMRAHEIVTNTQAYIHERA